MRRAVFSILVSIWLLAPPAEVGAASEPAPAPAADRAPSRAKAVSKSAPSPAGRKKPAKQRAEQAPDRPKLEPASVLSLQMQALNAQKGREVAVIQGQNRFTRCLDEGHEKLFCWMDNAVRAVDTRGLADNAPYDPELSTFKLKVLTRAGGKSREKSTDFKVRFRGDLALPRLEKNLHLFLDNAGRDSLPGTDPMKQESDMRLGMRAMFHTLDDGEFSLGGGLRWRDSHPVVYASLDWRWTNEMSGWDFCLNPRVVCYSDDGFGQSTVLTWTRPAGSRRFFQILTAERSAESMEGVEFEQSFRFYWLRSGKGRGWVAQASVFPHIQSSDWYWDDSLVNLTWRDALYRKWIYYTLTPQVQFPKEDEYQARPSLRIGLEILFGGKSSDLM